MGNQDRSNPKAAPILVFQGKVVKVGFLNRVGQAVRPGGLCQPNIQCKYQRNIASKRDY